MPRNSSGVYSKPAGTTAIVDTEIDPAPWNQLTSDLGNEITNSLPRDGSAPMIAPLKLDDGSQAVPGLSFSSDITTGIYRKGTGVGGLVAGGTEAANWSSGGLDVVGNLDVSGTISGEVFRGKLGELTLANNALNPATHIDIAAGYAASDGTTPFVMILTSALTKRLDATWAVGSGNGGWLDGASMPNGTGHVFLISRSDTGVVDVGMSASLTPTLPSGYDRKRRIGSIMRIAGAIKPFSQNGDEFLWTTPAPDMGGAPIGTGAAVVALTVPSGIKVNALFNANVVSNTAGTRVLFNAVDQAVAIADVPFGNYNLYVPAINQAGTSSLNVRTNTAGQVRVVSNATSATCTVSVVTNGFIDRRGRN